MGGGAGGGVANKKKFFCAEEDEGRHLSSPHVQEILVKIGQESRVRKDREEI